MFMRTVKMFVKPDEFPTFTKAYEERILTAFASVKGCRYAALMQSTRNPEECVSLTFWAAESDARTFEQSGEYEKLVNILSPHFSESPGLQLRLTEDLKLEYTASHEPEVRKFEAHSSEEPVSGGQVFLRMVSLKFHGEKVQEFKKHYEDHVVPVLGLVNGCRRAFLATPADDPSELISVTEWESEQAAHEYEDGGQFAAIVQSQQHFFSGLHILGMQWPKEMGGKVVTSDDVTADHHRVLASRRYV